MQRNRHGEWGPGDARFPSRRSREPGAPSAGRPRRTGDPISGFRSEPDGSPRRCHDAHASIRPRCPPVLNEAGTVEELRRIAPDISPSVARLPMPAYILDRNGVVRWLNMAAIREFGDMRGKRITQIVEPEYAAKARQEFAAKLLGTVAVDGGDGRGPHGGRAGASRWTSARRSSSSTDRSSASSGSPIRRASRPGRRRRRAPCS